MTISFQCNDTNLHPKHYAAPYGTVTPWQHSPLNKAMYADTPQKNPKNWGTSQERHQSVPQVCLKLSFQWPAITIQRGVYLCTWPAWRTELWVGGATSWRTSAWTRGRGSRDQVSLTTSVSGFHVACSLFQVPCYFCIIGDALSTRRCKLWSRAMCAHMRTHTVHKVLHRWSEWRCNQHEKVNPTSIERRN